jgi:hypothetical protein
VISPLARWYWQGSKNVPRHGTVTPAYDGINLVIDQIFGKVKR